MNERNITLTPEMISLIPEFGGNALLVAICLVYHSPDGETSAPDYSDIHEFTGLHRQTISNAINDLCNKMGVIQKTRRFSNSTIYTISTLVRLLYANNNINIVNTESIKDNSILPYTSTINVLMDDEEQANEPGPLAQLTDAFTNATGIPSFGISPRDVEAGQRMIEAGITPDDVSAACKKLLDLKYSLTGLKSIERTVYSIRAINSNGSDKPNNVEVFA